jgi:hypothetical protein
MAKASDQNGSDGEGRKLGERSGLDTDNVKTFLELTQKESFKFYKNLS